MKKSADNSSDTACSTATETSSPQAELFDLERDIPTTAEDVRVLRVLHRQPGKNYLPTIDQWNDLSQFENLAPRRSTSEGWEPFELD